MDCNGGFRSRRGGGAPTDPGRSGGTGALRSGYFEEGSDYLALQIEARRPGTVPGEMIDGLASMVDVGELSSRSIGVLRGESVEHVDEVEKLLKEREDDLEKLIAISHVKRAAEKGVTRAKLEEIRERIERDIKKFKELLGPWPMRRRPDLGLAATARLAATRT